MLASSMAAAVHRPITPTNQRVHSNVGFLIGPWWREGLEPLGENCLEWQFEETLLG